jgi:leucyl aminopeptidase
MAKKSIKAKVSVKRIGFAETKPVDKTAMGLPLATWVSMAQPVTESAPVARERRGFMIALGADLGLDSKEIQSLLSQHLAKWQLQILNTSGKLGELNHFQGKHGPVWILRSGQSGKTRTVDSLGKSGFASYRDLAGSCVAQMPHFGLETLSLEMHELTQDEMRGVFVGLEMAAYRFIENRNGIENRSGHSLARKKLPQILFKVSGARQTLSSKWIQGAGHLALSVNIARHLTNLPAGELNPKTYSELASELFAESKTVSVEVWEGERLKTEGMNLLLAVGAGAAEGPRMVHLRYRPEGSARRRPVAIVGKGVTFDSGGLDIKPSSGMRLMKKDMGGSAAALAVVKWAELSRLELPLDIYLSLAENSISSDSFRPGDILTARNGLSIEIHNTDAEGRLVLADAMDVAVSQTGVDAPSAIIDIATLTGAIKVGLGADIAGLFSDNDQLANLLLDAGISRGDLMWRMPLFKPYKSSLRSTVANYSNCSEGGFGGAITAALFLGLFVKDIPWAHLDIYAWKDSAGGAWSESGGSGQAVLALTEALTQLAKSKNG